MTTSMDESFFAAWDQFSGRVGESANGGRNQVTKQTAKEVKIEEQPKSWRRSIEEKSNDCATGRAAREDSCLQWRAMTCVIRVCGQGVQRCSTIPFFGRRATAKARSPSSDGMDKGRSSTLGLELGG